MLALLCALLAGCAAPGPHGVPPARMAKAYHSMPEAALPLARPSDATTLLDYQLEVARALHAANPGMVFEGPPPNPLRAVIVMRAEVDAIGGMRRLELVRAPWHDPWLEDLARETVRQAGPLPRPSMKLMNGAQSVMFTESWLFDYQGRFRLRTLALPQAEPPDQEPEATP
ncbi:MAG: hypothetical protein ACREVD_15255 [Burkholderiales bacterium]